MTKEEHEIVDALKVLTFSVEETEHGYFHGRIIISEIPYEFYVKTPILMLRELCTVNEADGYMKAQADYERGYKDGRHHKAKKIR